MAAESTLADINELVDQLESQVIRGTKIPGTGRVVVEVEEYLALIDQLRNAYPIEFSQARRVIQDRQRIILAAQAEAEKIVGAARDKAEYLISERGLTDEARQRSEHYLRDGRETSRRVMSKVDDYARGMFDDVETVIRVKLEEMESVMRQKLTELEQAKHTLTEQH
jgi:hypothetical protein